MEPWIIGHRGAAAYCRENTLESFRKAIELGADGIEFDIRRTADNTLIVHHDAEIAGTSLSRISYPEACDLALHHGYPLCRLDEVIGVTAGRLILDVELKEEGYETEVTDQLLASLPPDRFFFTSFSLESMRTIRRHNPGLRVGWLTDFISVSILDTLITSGMDFFLPRAETVTPRWIDPMHQSGLRVIPWTVNRPERIKKLLSYPCIKGLISDRPDCGLRTRARMKAIHGLWTTENDPGRPRS